MTAFNVRCDEYTYDEERVKKFIFAVVTPPTWQQNKIKFQFGAFEV